MLIKSILSLIYHNPNTLKHKDLKMASFLQKQGNEESQGTGNKVTDQEACFAGLLEANGFQFLSKDQSSIEENYYKYQTNGSQKHIDFEVYDKNINKILKFDLKHTTTKTFYFNDGWFEKDVIYIISWCPTKNNNKTLIGYGDNISTDEENEFMKELISIKKRLNEMYKKKGSLHVYFRFANQYLCEKFTEEFTFDKFNSVNQNLTQLIE